MPNLVQSFHGRDIEFLRIIARLWGIELAASNIDKAQNELATAMLDQALFIDMLDSLPADARLTFDELIKADGKLPWATFTRRFGGIREAGPGRRDREKIYLNPVSPAEVLFYRGLIAKAFFDIPAGAKEFAFIPFDFLNIINREELSLVPSPNAVGDPIEQNPNAIMTESSAGSSEPLGRPALPKEHTRPLVASDRLLDDATTLLAALRMGLPLPDIRISVNVVLEFLSAAKIIHPVSHDEKGSGGEPLIDAVRRFLEASRQNAREMLVTAWLESVTFNELRQVPSLVCEGEWSNKPLVTRKYLLTLLKAIPETTWWSLPAFIHSIKEKDPDFQRPAGDYDSWFIKRKSDGTYLRGFDNWNEVDGALVRYIITGPMFWLGLVELAIPADNDEVSAFRVISGKSTISVAETGKLHVSSQGKINVPRHLPRLARYQIARFCEWDVEKEDEYHYRVSTASLKKAAEQGLKVKQLLSLLARNAATEIPPAFIKALKRWELNGIEARVEINTILKVSRPEVLEELRRTKSARFLGETLGPVSIVIKPGAQAKVLAALAEMGLLADVGENE